jgi:hypothetical protein
MGVNSLVVAAMADDLGVVVVDDAAVGHSRTLFVPGRRCRRAATEAYATAVRVRAPH